MWRKLPGKVWGAGGAAPGPAMFRLCPQSSWCPSSKLAGLVLAILPTPPSACGQACPSLNTPELALTITPLALRLGRQGCPGHLSPVLGETLRLCFQAGVGVLMRWS